MNGDAGRCCSRRYGWIEMWRGADNRVMDGLRCGGVLIIELWMDV